MKIITKVKTRTIAAEEKDFSSLEGVKVDYIGSLGNSIRVTVVGCDYDLGISLAVEESEEYILCIRSPMIAKALKIRGCSEFLWRVKFFSIIRQIRKGIVTYAKCIKIFELANYGPLGEIGGSYGTEPSSENCAFNV